MKIHLAIYFGWFLLFATALQALELDEKPRTWMRADGQKAQGKLVDIVGDKISLEIRGKVFEFPLSDFSREDRDYVKGVEINFDGNFISNVNSLPEGLRSSPSAGKEAQKQDVQDYSSQIQFHPDDQLKYQTIIKENGEL
jgi:hypothetical protein